MIIKSEKQLESEYLEWIINELSNDNIENIDDYINSQNNTVNKFLKSELNKTRNKKQKSQNITNNKNKQSKGNNDEIRMKEYLEFYDWIKDNNTKKIDKKAEGNKRTNLHYKIYRYEILLIILFIFSTHTIQN